MQAQIIDYIINIVETILNRNLNSLDKWKDYLFGTGYAFTVFCVIIWYFYIRKNFLSSSVFLLIIFCVYLSTCIIFTANFSSPDRLRFPLLIIFALICVHFYIFRQYLNSLTQKIKHTYNFLCQCRILNSSVFIFICSGLLGALFFIIIFGTAILDFTYTDWLMSGGDLSQHYLGWRFFRNSPWYFPLGLMDNIVHPFKISMIYTDSIPLFAVFFKLISPVLPEQFQYFGLFGIICFILQGGLGALIVRKTGGNTVCSIIGSMFFLLSTIMVWRIYGHTSLAAHFIIFLCILLCLEATSNLGKQIVLWSCLLVLSVMIHLYFVPMVMIFMFFKLLHEYFLYKKMKNQLISIGLCFIVLIGTMFSIGAFHFVNTADGGLGYATMNLNAFINPIGMSRFINDMPLADHFQYEGNSYLGLGIIIVVIGVIFQLFQKNNISFQIIKKHKLTPYIFGIVISFLLFSLSPSITLNQYRLITYPVLYPIEYLWSIFRSTGRFTWPIVYIIMIICFWWITKQFSKKLTIIILSVLLIIQWVDLKPYFIAKGNIFKSRVAWQTELPSAEWMNLAKDYKSIFFIDSYIKLNSFLDLAANYKMTVNDAYLARTNSRLTDETKTRVLSDLINGESRDDTIYVFMNESSLAPFMLDTVLHFYYIDNVVIGVNTQETYLEEYSYLPLILH
ncbi:MAG: DUF6311 domain-containing protein [Treponema sp.]|nr:DUF6311 domain-containing protein [Treponema sp.]